VEELALTHGKVTIVDDGMLDKKIRLRDLKWHAVRARSGVWHATCTLQLHRCVVSTPLDPEKEFVVFPPEGTIVDHGDRDGLNNLQSNLTVTTACGNAANRAKKKTSKYKGVTAIRRKNKTVYRAYYSCNGCFQLVGHFQDEKIAALMRDEAVWEELGTLADLNFPENKDEYEKHKKERHEREKQATSK